MSQSQKKAGATPKPKVGRRERGKPQQPESTQHRDPEQQQHGTRAAGAGGDATSWSGQGGGNVLEWLAKKTTEGNSAGAAATKTGAIDFLNAQKKGGMVPKPRSKQQALTVDELEREVAVEPKKENPVAWLANKLPAAVMQPKTGTEHSNEASSAAVPATREGADVPSQQPASSPGTQGGIQLPLAPPPALSAQQVQGQLQQPQHGRRRPPGHVQQQQQPAQVTQQMSQQMLESLQQQQTELMEQNPEYGRWVQQQLALQQQHESTRMNLLGHLQHQERLSLERIEQERIDVPKILDLIDRHDITFICTDTGSGKSTSIPKALLELSADTKIVSTQPRRTATANIAMRVAQLRDERVGEDVGYWIRGEKHGDERTRLWYMTSYTLLLHLLNNPLHPEYTHIVLDEFHERQPDLEVTVALLKLCLRKKTASFKLIIMSATLNTDDWESYFDGLSVAIYKQSEPDHPIHDYFMEDVSALVGMPYQPPSGFIPTMVDHQLLENHMFVAQHLIMFLNMVANPQHSILVFLPGRANVEHFTMWAEMNLRDRVDVIPWHSAVELNVIEAAIHRKVGTRQKLYLATDIAEVSITLPDVVFVIDLALVKRPYIQPAVPATITFPPLMTQWISKGSVAQRRGRIGRVQQGFYFCLVSKTLVPQLPDYSTPPIQHSRIDELTLHALQLVAHPVAIFSICKGQPLIESISTSMATLTHLGCIVPKSDPLAAGESISEIFTNSAWSPLIMEEARSLLEDGGEIGEYVTTFIGRLLQLIPVSSQQGMLIFYGFLTGLESLMVLAAAAANSLSPFSLSVHESENQRNSKGRGRGRGRPQYDSVAKAMEATETAMKEYNRGIRSDLVAVVGAVLRYKIKLLELDATGITKWCKENCLSREKLMAIVELDGHIKYELSGFIPFRDVEDPYVLATQLDKCAAIVATVHCAAFAAQALEVTAGQGARETGVGLFTDLRAMPDLHAPSCFRWEHNDIVVPISISLRHSNLLVGFGTAIKSHKQFYLSLLLFAHRIQYATFCDDAGMYMQFRVTFNSTVKTIETDNQTGLFIVEFRKRASRVCASIRLRYSNAGLSEEEFDAHLAGAHCMPPMTQQQRDVMQQMSAIFQPMHLESMDVAVVENTEEELENESLLSFAVKASASAA